MKNITCNTPSVITEGELDALRSSFRDGDLVMVEWHDPHTLTRAPWDFWSNDDVTPRCSGLSVGFIYDRPEDREVEVCPNIADIRFDDGDHELGEVFIPYASIHSIMLLLKTSEALDKVTGATNGPR